MKPNTPEILCRLLAGSDPAPDEPPGWERLLAAARQMRLLGILAARLESVERPVPIPAAARRQLLSARRQAEYEAGQLGWTLRGLRRALGADTAVVLLKGAAYWAQDIPRLRGRTVGDVDILVPRTELERVAARLAEHGWNTTMPDAYDQHYYREWSHEWPPMQKPAGGLELDLHWHIVPPVGRPYFGESALWEQVRPAAQGWLVLDPVDQLLHAALHLIQHTTLCNRLRDVHDVDAMLRHWSARQAGFGPRLAARAEALGLTRPAWYALALAQRWFGTPLAGGLTEAWRRWRPSAPTRLAMQGLLALTIAPPPLDSESGWAREGAASVLLARHHWMRMRPRLLVRHLGHKALIRLRPRGAAAPRAPAPQ